MSDFNNYNLLDSIIKTLEAQNFTKATDIQKLAIKALMSGKSVVGIAETGSGKTLSYVLPILHLLKTLETQGQAVSKNSSPRAVVLVPTRELGDQVSKVFKEYTHDTRLRVRNVLGSSKMAVAKRNIANNFEIMLATPGRLMQLNKLNLINFDDVRILVIDEADQMLDQGFLPSINTLLNSCQPDIQTALFTATASKSVQSLIENSFSHAEFFQTENSHQINQNLEVINCIVPNGKRVPLLKKIVLDTKTKGSTLIFTNTREQCDKVQAELVNLNVKSGIYRGEMDKNERKQNLRNFRQEKISILVATDLASRGLDVNHVTKVINYHLPKEVENYLHRIGRTARAGRKGTVYNLVTERDQPLMQKLKSKKLL